MNDEDKVQYLANIYHLLLCDGNVDRMEERAFDEIKRDIRAGYLDAMKARKMAETEGFQVHLVGRWSERIANLEDMLFAAYCNGVLDPAEKKAIMECARQLGVSRAQFDMMQKEIKSRYAEFKANAI